MHFSCHCPVVESVDRFDYLPIVAGFDFRHFGLRGSTLAIIVRAWACRIESCRGGRSMLVG